MSLMQPWARWVYDKNLHEFQHRLRYSCKRVDALIGLFPTGATR